MASDSQQGYTYHFRLDHILPFRSQEERHERPETWLAGIAVGPVQGMLGGKTARRWRLLMVFMDHSILSYELGKDRDRDEGVEVLVI